MNSHNNISKHDVLIKDRKNITVTGVKEVLSFDEHIVSAITDGGDMTIEGEDLKIGALDTNQGILTVDGRINGILYYDEKSVERKGFLGKLFRS